MSWLKAHVIKERVRGMREEIKINLLNLDGTEFEIPEFPDVPVEIPSGGAAGALLAKASEADGDLEWVEGVEAPETENWILVPNADMTNGWTSLADSDNYRFKYRKRPDGMVEMSGVVLPGTPSESMFTLPVGYRPTTYNFVSPLFIVPAVNTSVNPVSYNVGVIGINPNGTVYVNQVPANTHYMNLTSVRFPVD